MSGIWHSIWSMASSILYLASGIWYLAVNLASGIWHLIHHILTSSITNLSQYLSKHTYYIFLPSTFCFTFFHLLHFSPFDLLHYLFPLVSLQIYLLIFPIPQCGSKIFFPFTTCTVHITSTLYEFNITRSLLHFVPLLFSSYEKPGFPLDPVF